MFEPSELEFYIDLAFHESQRFLESTTREKFVDEYDFLYSLKCGHHILKILQLLGVRIDNSKARNPNFKTVLRAAIVSQLRVPQCNVFHASDFDACVTSDCDQIQPTDLEKICRIIVTIYELASRLEAQPNFCGARLDKSALDPLVEYHYQQVAQRDQSASEPDLLTSVSESFEDLSLDTLSSLDQRTPRLSASITQNTVSEASRTQTTSQTSNSSGVVSRSCTSIPNSLSNSYSQSTTMPVPTVTPEIEAKVHKYLEDQAKYCKTGIIHENDDTYSQNSDLGASSHSHSMRSISPFENGSRCSSRSDAIPTRNLLRTAVAPPPRTALQFIVPTGENQLAKKSREVMQQASEHKAYRQERMQNPAIVQQEQPTWQASLDDWKQKRRSAGDAQQRRLQLEMEQEEQLRLAREATASKPVNLRHIKPAGQREVPKNSPLLLGEMMSGQNGVDDQSVQSKGSDKEPFEDKPPKPRPDSAYGSKQLSSTSLEDSGHFGSSENDEKSSEQSLSSTNSPQHSPNEPSVNNTEPIVAQEYTESVEMPFTKIAVSEPVETVSPIQKLAQLDEIAAKPEPEPVVWKYNVQNITNTDEQKIILKQKQNVEKGFGFSLRGGKDRREPVTVAGLIPGSTAETSGLLIGDEILTFNGENLPEKYAASINMIIREAVKLGEAELSIRRLTPGTTGSDTGSLSRPRSRFPATFDQKREIFSRPVSTPLEPITASSIRRASLKSPLSPPPAAAWRPEPASPIRRPGRIENFVPDSERRGPLIGVYSADMNRLSPGLNTTPGEYKVTSLSGKRSPGNIMDFIPESERRHPAEIYRKPSDCEIGEEVDDVHWRKESLKIMGSLGGVKQNGDAVHEAPVPCGNGKFDELRLKSPPPIRNFDLKPIDAMGLNTLPRYSQDRDTDSNSSALSPSSNHSSERQSEGSVSLPQSRPPPIPNLKSEEVLLFQRAARRKIDLERAKLLGLDLPKQDRAAKNRHSFHELYVDTEDHQINQPQQMSTTPEIKNTVTSHSPPKFQEMTRNRKSAFQPVKIKTPEPVQPIQPAPVIAEAESEESWILPSGEICWSKMPLPGDKPKIATPSTNLSRIQNNHVVTVPLPEPVPPSHPAAAQPQRVPPRAETKPSVSVSGKQRCAHCRTELGRGAAMTIESLSLYYHVTCFRCYVCGLSLTNGGIQGADVRVRTGKLHCQLCFSSEENGIQYSQV